MNEITSTGSVQKVPLQDLTAGLEGVSLPEFRNRASPDRRLFIAEHLPRAFEQVRASLEARHIYREPSLVEVQKVFKTTGLVVSRDLLRELIQVVNERRALTGDPALIFKRPYHKLPDVTIENAYRKFVQDHNTSPDSTQLAEFISQLTQIEVSPRFISSAVARVNKRLPEESKLSVRAGRTPITNAEILAAYEVAATLAHGNGFSAPSLMSHHAQLVRMYAPREISPDALLKRVISLRTASNQLPYRGNRKIHKAKVREVIVSLYIKRGKGVTIPTVRRAIFRRFRVRLGRERISALMRAFHASAADNEKKYFLNPRRREKFSKQEYLRGYLEGLKRSAANGKFPSQDALRPFVPRSNPRMALTHRRVWSIRARDGLPPLLIRGEKATQRLALMTAYKRALEVPGIRVREVQVEAARLLNRSKVSVHHTLHQVLKTATKYEFLPFLIPEMRGRKADQLASDVTGNLAVKQKITVAQVWALCSSGVPDASVLELVHSLGKAERVAHLRAAHIGYCTRTGDNPFHGRLVALALAAKQGRFPSRIVSDTRGILEHGELHLLPGLHQAMDQYLQEIVDKSMIESIVLNPQHLVTLLEAEISNNDLNAR